MTMNRYLSFQFTSYPFNASSVYNLLTGQYFSSGRSFWGKTRAQNEELFWVYDVPKKILFALSQNKTTFRFHAVAENFFEPILCQNLVKVLQLGNVYM